MNLLDSGLMTGTLGELLVQIRLLQYGVQAAPPIKDSGDDLIAIKGHVFKALQIKTTKETSRPIRFDLRNLPLRLCHILACVVLVSDGSNLRLDECRIYLIPKAFVDEQMSISESKLQGNELRQDLIDELFS